MEEKTYSRIFTCQECNFIFKKRAHLLRHQLVHNDERPYKCTQCEKSFRSSFHLNRHAASHAGVKSFKCPHEGCQVSCLLEWNLKRHIKRTHMGKFKCEKCGEEFRKNKLLQLHKSTEHKSVICCEFPGCVQTFSVPWKMKQHLKMHKEKAYVCPVKNCLQKFNFWSECRLHTTECKKREVSCDVCGKMFRTRSNLKAHRKIHSEEREVFQCTYEGCGRFYTKQYNLKVHVQSFHMNIRPFVCSKDGCNKRFHFQHLLRKHYENMHDKKGVEETEEKKQRKPKPKSRRINNPSTVSSITGYIPELWTRMTPEEVKSYVEGKMLSESDENSSDTTQAEMPPIMEPKEVEMAPDTEEENVEKVGSSNSDEVHTDDTVPVNHSSDEFEQITELVEIKPFMYKPVVKLVKKSALLNRPRSPLSYANVVNSEASTDESEEREECMITNTDDNTNLTESIKKNPTECIRSCSVVIPKLDLSTNLSTEQCMKEFSDRFRNMFDQSVAAANTLNIHGMCVIQAMNESDSSDSDVQNKQVACVV